MKYTKSTLKQAIIYFLLIIFFLSLIFFFHLKNLYLLLSCVLLVFIFITILILGYEKSRFLYKKNMILNIIIYTLSFQIICYLLGLYFGFIRNGYSLNFINIIKNITPVLFIIILTEFFRYCLNVKSQENKVLIILSLITFVLLDIVLQVHLYDLSIKQNIIKLISSVVIPSIAKNILLTYLSIRYGYSVNIVYRIILELPIYFIPIYPSFGIYIESVLMICFPSLVLYHIYKNNSKSMNIEVKQGKNVLSKASILIIITILFIMVSFTSGIFYHMAITIGSGSMSPNINKGDIVIVKKINNKEIKKLKKGDVLAFYYHDKIIVHRIVKIDKKESSYSFQTKGDHNDNKDSWITSEEELVGKAIWKIPFVGYPTVWLNEMLNGGLK